MSSSSAPVCKRTASAISTCRSSAARATSERCACVRSILPIPPSRHRPSVSSDSRVAGRVPILSSERRVISARISSRRPVASVSSRTRSASGRPGPMLRAAPDRIRFISSVGFRTVGTAAIRASTSATRRGRNSAIRVSSRAAISASCGDRPLRKSWSAKLRPKGVRSTSGDDMEADRRRARSWSRSGESGWPRSVSRKRCTASSCRRSRSARSSALRSCSAAFAVAVASAAASIPAAAVMTRCNRPRSSPRAALSIFCAS